MISSYLTEEDLFSASWVCHYWRSVIVSSPSAWTRVSCCGVRRTLIGLDRCKSLPIRLQLKHTFSTAALEGVLLHGSSISSLTINYQPDHIALLRQLFMFSRPSLKQLHICSGAVEGWSAKEKPVHDIWNHMPYLRELIVYRYSIPIEQLNAPNLLHLALDNTGYLREITVRTVLDTLRGCPLLETFLLCNWRLLQHDPLRRCSSVRLPSLRSIELGAYEVKSGLIAYLDFPPNIAAAFPGLALDDVYGNIIPPAVFASTQQVLRRIDIRSITFVAPLPPGTLGLVYFEGLEGSLEISAAGINDHEELRSVFFGPKGVLFSHSPRIGNVREIHIQGCSFDASRGSCLNTAMPKIASISFFQCNEPTTFDPLAPKKSSSLLFPYLERILVLGRESGLENMARRRKTCGVPLKTLIIGQGPRGPSPGQPGDYAKLGGLVGALQVGCPTEVSGIRNEIRDIWSTLNSVAGPVSPNGNLNNIGPHSRRFCSNSLRVVEYLSFADSMFLGNVGGYQLCKRLFTTDVVLYQR